MSITPPASSSMVDEPLSSIDRRLLRDLDPARRALLVSITLGVLITATVVAQAFLLAHLIGWALRGSHEAFPWGIVIALGAAMAARALVGALGEMVAARAGASVVAALRASLLDAVVERGPTWLAPQKTGQLVVTVTRGLRSLEPYFTRYLPAAVVAALAPPIAIVALAITDWPSALLALALVATVPILMIRLGRRAAGESDRQWRRLTSLSSRTLELLRGLPTLRALGREDRGRDEVVAASGALVESIDATLSASLASGAALEFLAGVGVGLVAMLAGLRLLNGSMTIVPALTVILLTPEVFLPLRRAGAEFHASTEGRSAAASLYRSLDEATALPSVVTRTHRVETLTPIELRGVNVVYPGTTELALENFSMIVNEGERITLRGASGSGKTTVLSLLCGFITPTSGSLLMGGQDALTCTLEDLRAQIALVPQRPHVFADSIRSNLLLGASADEDTQLFELLERVGLAHLAPRAAGGLDRRLNEGGGSISAGERQRLGLARAILLDRPVLLLDEATAHLDDRTVALLQGTLDPFLEPRTVIEAGHRRGLLGTSGRVVSLERSSEHAS